MEIPDLTDKIYDNIKKDEAVQLYSQLIDDEKDDAVREQITISFGKYLVKNFFSKNG